MLLFSCLTSYEEDTLVALIMLSMLNFVHLRVHIYQKWNKWILYISLPWQLQGRSSWSISYLSEVVAFAHCMKRKWYFVKNRFIKVRIWKSCTLRIKIAVINYRTSHFLSTLSCLSILCSINWYIYPIPKSTSSWPRYIKKMF